MSARLSDCENRILAVECGGGATRRGDPVSLTTLALLVINRNGQVHVSWSQRLYAPYDHFEEAAQIPSYFKKFRCKFLAHDCTGAGVLRETFLIQIKTIKKRRSCLSGVDFS